MPDTPQPPDFLTTIDIDVKQKHIDAGDKEKCESCAVALALIDSGFHDVKVGYEGISFEYNGLPYYLDIDEKDDLRLFLYQFDAGLYPPPQKFENLPVIFDPAED